MIISYVWKDVVPKIKYFSAECKIKSISFATVLLASFINRVLLNVEHQFSLKYAQKSFLKQTHH